MNHTTGTRGAVTNPTRRFAPESIEPWTGTDCEQEQAMIYTLLREMDFAGAESLVFPARYYVDRVGDDLGRLESEIALLHLDNDTLHKPAERLLRTLLANSRIMTAISRRQQHPDARQAYRPGMVSFTTYLNGLRQTCVVAIWLGLRESKQADKLIRSAGSEKKRDAAHIAPVLGPAAVFRIFEPETDPPSDSINVASGSNTVVSNTPQLFFPERDQGKSQTHSGHHRPNSGKGQGAGASRNYGSRRSELR